MEVQSCSTRIGGGNSGQTVHGVSKIERSCSNTVIPTNQPTAMILEWFSITLVSIAIDLECSV